MRTVSPEPFQLGPKSSQLFLDMLTNQPVCSQITQMPAASMGKFRIGPVQYLWHGNAVIRGAGREERLWHGPYLQRLIVEVMRKEPRNRDSMQRILDTLEQDPTIASTPLEGPGKYPGGVNDAVHPAHLNVGNTNSWQVFEPQTKKP